MKLVELQGIIDAASHLDYQMDDKGIVIENSRFETRTHATFAAVELNTAATILASTSQGKDVDHITRVTGYFSRTSGWNKGKKAELEDRHRSAIV